MKPFHFHPIPSVFGPHGRNRLPTVAARVTLRGLIEQDAAFLFAIFSFSCCRPGISIVKRAKYLDQLLSVLEEDWWHAKAVWGPKIQIH